MDAGPEDAKQVVRTIVERILNARDTALVPKLVHPNLQEEFVAHYHQLIDAFPDVQVDIDHLIAEGSTVAARLTIRGTHKGIFAGVSPTGKRVTYGSFRFYDVLDGMLQRTWAMQDRLGLMEQLGAVHPPAGVRWAAGDRDKP